MQLDCAHRAPPLPSVRVLGPGTFQKLAWPLLGVSSSSSMGGSSTLVGVGTVHPTWGLPNSKSHKGKESLGGGGQSLQLILACGPWTPQGAAA